MDKGCSTCALNGRLAYKGICKECVASGTFSGWSAKPDPVNHPAHYTECSLECIDVMLAVFGRKAVTDFCIINAFKYMWRYEYKNGLEDLQKAERYIAMATTFQTGDTEHENRIINMKAELEILMRRVSE